MSDTREKYIWRPPLVPALYVVLFMIVAVLVVVARR
jgi:hypothetical protein